MAGLVANVRGAGGAIPGSGGRVLPSGTSRVCPRDALRPTTSETRLSPPGGLAWWRLDTNLPGDQAYPENRAAWALEADEMGCHVWEYGKDIKREVLARGLCVSGAGGRSEFDQRSDDRTEANLAYTQAKRVLTGLSTW